MWPAPLRLSLLLVVANVLLAPTTHAWGAVRAANKTSLREDRPTPFGTQPVHLGVGCEASVSYPTDTPLDATQPRVSFVVENPIAEFISLHFARLALPPDDYLVIRPTDPTDPRKPLTLQGGKTAVDFFSQALPTKSVTIELFAQGRHENDTTHHPTTATCHGFAIDQYHFLAGPASFDGSVREAVCDKDDSGEAACFRGYPDVFQRSDAVARLLIHKDGSSYFCTGWLVGCEGHVLTNHHCISNSLHAANTEFEFVAEGKSCSDQCNKAFGCEGKTRAIKSQLVVASEALDYALVKIEGNLWKEYGYLQMREGGAKLDERIYIPQHPAGWGKRIAMKNGEDWGKVLELDNYGCLPDQVSYYLDTQGGSSGSPVLGWTDNAVVALHHCGGCPNTAVNIDKIIKDLRAKELLPKCAIYQPDDKPHGKDKNDKAT